ncbi:hypothetical protein TWF569_010975 [Orbilia oligospora]|nr:hypothetical protein TWF569_010975 [Orbilia oligospora]KAF3178795.1 hypothetical protein TWF225_007814 [Orbilia oligospora]KAF3245672.1 hypothetical protein TWF128_009376 [Orbilia oligospora]
MRVVKHSNSERDRVLQGEEGGVEHCVKQPEAVCLPPPTASKKSTLMYGSLVLNTPNARLSTLGRQEKADTSYDVWPITSN